jgi:aspartoacylase
MNLRKVLIVGGTHGNEPTGIYLLKKWERDPGPVTRPSFETGLFLANPKAEALGRRYVDKDLNRCFLKRDLNDSALISYEDSRAKEINYMFGPKPESAYDLIIDMHTSTADMGITLICDDNKGTLQIAAAAKAQMPQINIYCIKESERIQSCLRSIAPHGIGIEIGPVPQNLLRHDILDQMTQTVSVLLDVVHKANTSSGVFWPEEVEAFIHIGQVMYPDIEQCPSAVIHRDLEDKNFQKIEKHTPIFIGSDHSVVRYKGPSNACAAFINEAAYYEKRVAFSLARKIAIKP